MLARFASATLSFDAKHFSPFPRVQRNPRSYNLAARFLWSTLKVCLLIATASPVIPSHSSTSRGLLTTCWHFHRFNGALDRLSLKLWHERGETRAKLCKIENLPPPKPKQSNLFQLRRLINHTFALPLRSVCNHQNALSWRFVDWAERRFVDQLAATTSGWSAFARRALSRFRQPKHNAKEVKCETPWKPSQTDYLDSVWVAESSASKTTWFNDYRR